MADWHNCPLWKPCQPSALPDTMELGWLGLAVVFWFGVLWGYRYWVNTLGGDK